MEQVRKKKEQKDLSRMNTVQMASVIGNQAVVQMMPADIAWTFRDVCTPHFIREHLLDGTDATMLSQRRMNRLRNQFLAEGRPMQMVFDEFYLVGDIRDGIMKLLHLENRRY